MTRNRIIITLIIAVWCFQVKAEQLPQLFSIIPEPQGINNTCRKRIQCRKTTNQSVKKGDDTGAGAFFYKI